VAQAASSEIAPPRIKRGAGFIRASAENKFRRWWQRLRVSGKALRQANPEKELRALLPVGACRGDRRLFWRVATVGAGAGRSGVSEAIHWARRLGLQNLLEDFEEPIVIRLAIIMCAARYDIDFRNAAQICGEAHGEAIPTFAEPRMRREKLPIELVASPVNDRPRAVQTVDMHVRQARDRVSKIQIGRAANFSVAAVDPHVLEA
jgi:hypothetical protein